MKKIVISSAIGIVLTMLVMGSAFAASNPQGSGQPGAPNETCGAGNATSQPKGFLTGGFTYAASVYAGSTDTPSQQNAQSTHAISQYDVACFQQTSNGH